MKFGKVIDSTELENINFNLPPEPQESLDYLNSLKKDSDLKIYIGAPVWGAKEWRGKIYPEKLDSKEFLKYYAKSFNSIELNTTHYRLPEQSDIFNWVKEVNADFKFCPKVTQSISHFGGLTNKAKVDEFFNRMQSFESNLGIIFMQFHQNFSPKRFNDFSKFVGFLPENPNLAIELRHPDWFKNSGIFNYLRSKKISSVITDVAGNRDVLHMNITSNTVAVRFTGNNLHPTDYFRIDQWVQKIKEWNNTGLKNLYFFVHEPEDIGCPEISDYLIKKLEANNLKTTAQMQFISNQELSLF